MDYGLKGKHALVTGSASGCGKEIALLLAQEGARVTLHDLPSKEESLRENARLCGNGADIVMADLSKEEEVLRMFQEAGSLDLLINNAGIWPTAYVEDMTSESFRTTLEIDLIAPFLLSREFCRQLKKEGRSAELQQGSVYGTAALWSPGLLHYPGGRLHRIPESLRDR